MQKNEAEKLHRGSASGDKLSHEAIRAQLERILGHEEFNATHKMREFLRFVVEETLAGRADTLKGFTIAVEVFDRSSDFDPAHDPVVRIQAGRLRRALERYYLVSGGSDLIRIDIPKGGYVPAFTLGLSNTSKPASGQNNEALSRTVESFPSVLVRPFRNATGKAEWSYLGDGLATELCIELSHYQDIRVMIYREGAYGDRNQSPLPRFTIDGNIRVDEETLKITMQLIETSSGEQLWVDTFARPIDSGKKILFQEETAREIAVHIGGDFGIINKTLSAEYKSVAVTDLTTYQAILKGLAYDQAISPEPYFQALEALRAAFEKDPKCGLCAGLLAFLYADNIAFEFFSLDQTPLEEAVDLAQHAAVLEPANQIVRLALGRLRMLNNDLDAALSETESALSLNPNSLLYMDMIGYQLAFLGEWERGVELIRKAIRLNPFFRVQMRFALWADCFRLSDYPAALAELDMLHGTGHFWKPLARAATLGQTGQISEGKAAVEQLLTYKPDFRERGRILIGHGIKSDALFDQVIAGLEKSGLTLK